MLLRHVSQGCHPHICIRCQNTTMSNHRHCASPNFILIGSFRNTFSNTQPLWFLALMPPIALWISSTWHCVLSVSKTEARTLSSRPQRRTSDNSRPRPSLLQPKPSLPIWTLKCQARRGKDGHHHHQETQSRLPWLPCLFPSFLHPSTRLYAIPFFLHYAMFRLRSSS